MSKWCVGICLIFLLLASGEALAQSSSTRGCPNPNPNINAPPFVDGCPIPASTLNRLFQGAYGGLTPGVHTCATVTVNSAGYISAVATGTCSGGGTLALGLNIGGSLGLNSGGSLGLN
jgi:hypothetical protein